MNFPNQFYRYIYTAIAFISFLFLALGSTDESSSNSSNSGSNSISRDDCDKPSVAYYIEQIVKERLKSPSTAKFPGYATKRDQLNCIGNDNYTITSWVDAQNSFGGVVRKNYYCKFSYNNNATTVLEFTWIDQ